VQSQLLAKRFFEQLKKNVYADIHLEAPEDDVTFRTEENSGR